MQATAARQAKPAARPRRAGAAGNAGRGGGPPLAGSKAVPRRKVLVRRARRGARDARLRDDASAIAAQQPAGAGPGAAAPGTLAVTASEGRPAVAAAADAAEVDLALMSRLTGELHKTYHPRAWGEESHEPAYSPAPIEYSPVRVENSPPRGDLQSPAHSPPYSPASPARVWSPLYSPTSPVHLWASASAVGGAEA